MPINFKEIFNSLTQGVSHLAETSLQNFVGQATADGKNMLNAMRDNLKNWTMQLANDEISKADFKFLVLGQKDLLELVALKQAGLTLVQINEFKNSVLNLVINTVTGALVKV